MATHDTMTHDEAIELLPWLANGSLTSAERETVESHAASCIICRRELAELQALQAAIDSTTAESEVPAPDMRRINARIDAQLARASRPRELLSALRRMFASPWRVAFAAQTVALLVVAALWLQPDDTQPAFRTLTAVDPLPAGHYIRVVFDPTLGERDVATLLEANGLDIVSGPSERGVVTLQFADETNAEQRDAIIERMRDDDRVLFAQPVANEG